MHDAPVIGMAGWQSHTEIVAWQLANEVKLGIYRLIRVGPVSRDSDFCDQIRRSARSAPRLIAEGFGRFLPREFVKYLRWANGELKETFDALQDGRDQGYFSEDDSPVAAPDNESVEGNWGADSVLGAREIS